MFRALYRRITRAKSTKVLNKITPRHRGLILLKIVSTDWAQSRLQLLGVTGIYMAKYADHHSRLKAVYFIDEKSDTLHTLCKFI